MTIAEKLQKMTVQERQALLLKTTRESHEILKSKLRDQSYSVVPNIVNILEALLRYLETEAASKS